jgi:hypothetical protein
MSLSFHPLAELDRLLTHSQGDLLMGTPLSKYREASFSTASSETLFGFIKDSHQAFIGQWDNRRNQLIMNIITGIMAYSGSGDYHKRKRITHLNFFEAFTFPIEASEGARPSANMHPFTYQAIHEYMHARMSVFWAGSQGQDTQNIPSPEELHPRQPQLEMFRLQAKELLSAIALRASRDTVFLRELIQANEEDPYLKPQELFVYLSEQGVTENQFLLHSGFRVKRDHLEGGFGL